MLFGPPVASCDSTWCVLRREAQQRLSAQGFTGLGTWAPLSGMRPGPRLLRQQVSAETSGLRDGVAQRGRSVTDPLRASPVSSVPRGTSVQVPLLSVGRLGGYLC